MKVYIVMEDVGYTYEPFWVIQKVYAKEASADEYAKGNMRRDVREWEITE